MTTLTIHCETLTPIWTGGVGQESDRLHETGLIGSLRWWYEALVRGLGGYACDPTAEGRKCPPYNPEVGKRSVCPACYLFGTTGWARLFTLRAAITSPEKTAPVRFVTSLGANRRWLGQIFPATEMSLPYGNLDLSVVTRGEDDAYAIRQIAWTIATVAKHGGLGAKLQHGFGQIRLLSRLDEYTAAAESSLRASLDEFLNPEEGNDPTWPTFSRFFSRTYHIPGDGRFLALMLGNRRRLGAETDRFIPCVFDLRYRGSELGNAQLGFRQWLKTQGWRSDDIVALLGETRPQSDRDRSASRLLMGMPWRHGAGHYVLRVYGFLPVGLEVGCLTGTLDAYMDTLHISLAKTGE
jgi:CRISPR-associated protein Cmr1